MSAVYEKPPIQEAICEFQFSEGEWKFTTAAEIYRAFVDDYPAQPEAQQIVSAPAPQAGSVQFVSQSRFALRNEARDQAVMIAPGNLSVHALRPYPGWEIFQRRAEDALRRYREVRVPTHLHRVAVRAINRIEIEDDALDLSQWFVHAPGTLSTGIEYPLLFAHQETYACPNGAWLILNFATPQPKHRSTEQPDQIDDTRVIILDLNAIIAPPSGIEWGGVGATLEEMHRYVSEAFESSITDALRERFHAITS